MTDPKHPNLTLILLEETWAVEDSHGGVWTPNEPVEDYDEDLLRRCDEEPMTGAWSA